MTLLVYKSSAGSGKTYSLVRTYLSLLLRNPSSYRNILGVTFTNKAANEMKSRVIAALEGIAAVDPMHSAKYSGLLDELCIETGLDKETVKSRAAAALTELLHHYGDFSISTIDSFVHRLVRTFTFDLGLPQQFDIELNADYIIDKCVDDLLSRIGTDELITHASIDLLLYELEDEKSWQIEKKLKEFGMNLLEEKSYIHARNLAGCNYSDFQRVRQKWRDFCRDFESRLSTKAARLLNFLDTEMILESDLAGGSTSSIIKFLQRLRNREVEHAFNLKSWRAYLESGKWFSSKVTAIAKASIISNQQMLTESLISIVQVHDEQSGRYYLGKLLVPQLYKLALLSALQKSLSEIMDEHNLVHISEFNKRISDIITGVSAPYIYERMGERYHHFMIDEFQDTSVMQWLNFLPLIDNSLANGNLNLLVGDGKQAIYRWRNGDVEQFIHLPRLNNPNNDAWIVGAGDNLLNNYEERLLNKNFRSSSTIVSFNNSFFEYCKQFLAPDQQNVYDGQQQNVVYKTTGYVEIQFLPEEDTDKKLSYLTHTLKLIHSLLDDGYAKSDITILVRKNAEGSLLANYLLGNNISVVSADSLLVSSSPRVKALMAAICWIANPSDDVARNDFFYFTSIIKDADKRLWTEFYSQEAKAKQSGETAALLQPFDEKTLAYLSTSNLYDMLEALMRLLKFNELSDPYIQFLLEYVHEFSVSSKGGIKELVDDWRQKSESLSVIIPETTDSVRVMTIHKAKGLEFKVVIYPFANEKLKNCSKSNLWVDLGDMADNNIRSAYLTCAKSLEKTPLKHFYDKETERSKLDLVNLVYVAFTRAIDRLYIISEAPPSNSATISLPGLLLGYIREKDLDADEQNRYCMGNQTPPHHSEKTMTHVASLGMASHDWTEKIIFTTDKRVEQTDRYLTNSRNKGIVVHELLSKISTKEQIESVLDHFVFNGRISSADKFDYQQMLVKIFALDIFNEAVQSAVNVRNEQELIGEDGQVLRPDRVIEFADRIVLIDFKTGEARRDHRKQIENYAKTLNLIYPHPVESYLLYLNDDGELIAC